VLLFPQQADLNCNIQDDTGAFYGVTSQYESSENMTITCSTKVCSFGKQVVEKVEVGIGMGCHESPVPFGSYLCYSCLPLILPEWVFSFPGTFGSVVHHCVPSDTAVYKILVTCCLGSISILPVAAFCLQLTSVQPPLSQQKSVEGKMLFAPISKHSSSHMACLNSTAMTEDGALCFFTTYGSLTCRKA